MAVTKPDFLLHRSAVRRKDCQCTADVSLQLAGFLFKMKRLEFITGQTQELPAGINSLLNSVHHTGRFERLTLNTPGFAEGFLLRADSRKIG